MLSCLALCMFRKWSKCQWTSSFRFCQSARSEVSLFGGRSPCQGNSFPNRRRQGLLDDRSLQPALLVSLVHDLRNHSATKDLDVFAILENASAPAEVLSRYTLSGCRFLPSSSMLVVAVGLHVGGLSGSLVVKVG